MRLLEILLLVPIVATPQLRAQTQEAVQAGVDGMTVNFPDKLIAYLEAQHHPWE